ncbi:hypothetical protein MAR_015226 [Mya arenaria]|uniref:Uncharacterized protein n=1 Tax=Mya arenaria TaxID=6604 RepID=A0ABY7FJP0_MYAAR|nr:hypothetical protein MAR_015226 [Mya arenaria]
MDLDQYNVQQLEQRMMSESTPGSQKKQVARADYSSQGNSQQMQSGILYPSTSLSGNRLTNKAPGTIEDNKNIRTEADEKQGSGVNQSDKREGKQPNNSDSKPDDASARQKQSPCDGGQASPSDNPGSTGDSHDGSIEQPVTGKDQETPHDLIGKPPKLFPRSSQLQEEISVGDPQTTNTKRTVHTDSGGYKTMERSTLHETPTQSKFTMRNSYNNKSIQPKLKYTGKGQTKALHGNNNQQSAASIRQSGISKHVSLRGDASNYRSVFDTSTGSDKLKSNGEYEISKQGRVWCIRDLKTNKLTTLKTIKANEVFFESKELVSVDGVFHQLIVHNGKKPKLEIAERSSSSSEDERKPNPCDFSYGSKSDDYSKASTTPNSLPESEEPKVEETQGSGDNQSNERAIKQQDNSRNKPDYASRGLKQDPGDGGQTSPSDNPGSTGDSHDGSTEQPGKPPFTGTGQEKTNLHPNSSNCQGQDDIVGARKQEKAADFVSTENHENELHNCKMSKNKPLSSSKYMIIRQGRLFFIQDKRDKDKECETTNEPSGKKEKERKIVNIKIPLNSGGTQGVDEKTSMEHFVIVHVNGDEETVCLNMEKLMKLNYLLKYPDFLEQICKTFQPSYILKIERSETEIIFPCSKDKTNASKLLENILSKANLVYTELPVNGLCEDTVKEQLKLSQVDTKVHWIVDSNQSKVLIVCHRSDEVKAARYVSESIKAAKSNNKSLEMPLCVKQMFEKELEDTFQKDFPNIQYKWSPVGEYRCSMTLDGRHRNEAVKWIEFECVNSVGRVSFEHIMSGCSVDAIHKLIETLHVNQGKHTIYWDIIEKEKNVLFCSLAGAPAVSHIEKRLRNSIVQKSFDLPEKLSDERVQTLLQFILSELKSKFEYIVGEPFVTEQSDACSSLQFSFFKKDQKGLEPEIKCLLGKYRAVEVTRCFDHNPVKCSYFKIEANRGKIEKKFHTVLKHNCSFKGKCKIQIIGEKNDVDCCTSYIDKLTKQHIVCHMEGPDKTFCQIGEGSAVLNIPKWESGKEKYKLSQAFKSILDAAEKEETYNIAVAVIPTSWQSHKHMKIIFNTFDNYVKKRSAMDPSINMTFCCSIEGTFEDCIGMFNKAAEKLKCTSQSITEKMEIVINSGSFAHVAAEVLVNSANVNLKMKEGKISSLILMREGGSKREKKKPKDISRTLFFGRARVHGEYGTLDNVDSQVLVYLWEKDEIKREDKLSKKDPRNWDILETKSSDALLVIEKFQVADTILTEIMNSMDMSKSDCSLIILTEGMHNKSHLFGYIQNLEPVDLAGKNCVVLDVFGEDSCVNQLISTVKQLQGIIVEIYVYFIRL